MARKKRRRMEAAGGPSQSLHSLIEQLGTIYEAVMNHKRWTDRIKRELGEVKKQASGLPAIQADITKAITKVGEIRTALNDVTTETARAQGIIGRAKRKLDKV